MVQVLCDVLAVPLLPQPSLLLISLLPGQAAGRTHAGTERVFLCPSPAPNHSNELENFTIRASFEASVNCGSRREVVIHGQVWGPRPDFFNLFNTLP